MKPGRAQLSGEQGFALLVVLWSLVLLGLLTTQILASGRTALVLAGNLRAAAEAKAAADGAINEAIFHLAANGDAHWTADGSTHILGRPGLPVSVRVNSLSGKINPNLAPAPLLAGLSEAVGSSPQKAKQIALAIADWRGPAASKQQAKTNLAAYRQAGLPYGPPGHPFADLSQLGDVAGMTPSLLAKMLPHMSLFQNGLPNPKLADPIVRQALALSVPAGPAGPVAKNTMMTVSIEAVAGTTGQVAIRREAIVSLSGGNGKLPFQMLSLTDGY